MTIKKYMFHCGNKEWIQQRLDSHKPNKKPISKKTIANTKKEFLFLDRHLEYKVNTKNFPDSITRHPNAIV